MKKIILFTLLAFSLPALAQNKKSGAFITDGISSPIHEKYKGKIVFASTNAAIKNKQENEADFINKATLGNPVYFRVYLDNSLGNYAQQLLPKASSATIIANAMYKVNFYLDGAAAGTAFITEDLFQKTDKESWTTFKGALKTADGDTFIGANLFADFVSAQESRLTVGDHKFRIDLLPYLNNPETREGPVVASGELTLTVGKNVIDPNDPAVCLPKAKMTDKLLETKLLAAYRANGTFGGEPKEVRIVSSKWEIRNHKISGAVLRRAVTLVVAVTQDGKCRYKKLDGLQDFDGVKFQEDVYLEAHLLGEKEVNCKCLK